MEIKIPPFSDKYGQALSVCADPVNEDLDLSSCPLPEGNKDITVAFNDGLVIVDLWRHSLKNNHLHIEVFKTDYYPKPPPPSATVEAIQSILGHIESQKMLVRAIGRFEASIDDLPNKGMVRSAIDTMNVKSGDVAVQQTGAAFSFTSPTSPLREMSWSFDQEEKTTSIKIEIEKEVSIGPDYLVDLYNDTKKLFDAWIMVQDESKI